MMKPADQKNAARRMKYQINKFSPPVEVVTPVEESIEFYRNRLAELKAENDDLTAKLNSVKAVVLPKQKRLSELNKQCAKAAGETQTLLQAIRQEKRRQKLVAFQEKRARINGRR